METDDRDNRQGRDEGTTNVVRLPRDWLGPRDELVPFGPSAWGESGGGDVLELAGRHDRGDSAPDAFWGGDLDAIPQPVIAPSAAQKADAQPPVAVEPRHRPRLTRRPALPRRLSGPYRFQPSHVLARRVSPSGWRALGALGVAVIATAGAVALGGSTSHPSRASTAYRAQASQSRPRSIALPSVIALRPHRPVHLLIDVKPTHARHAPRPHRSAPPPASTATYVKAYSSTATSQPTVAATPAPVTTQPSTSNSSSSSSSTRSGPTTATAHKTHAGPVGQGAAFGPGHLG